MESLEYREVDIRVHAVTEDMERNHAKYPALLKEKHKLCCQESH
jgi:uncharacterized protein YijF (DUF1287 family)